MVGPITPTGKRGNYYCEAAPPAADFEYWGEAEEKGLGLFSAPREARACFAAAGRAANGATLAEGKENF